MAASNGHVRDLPKSQLGIDVDNDFEPKYITIRGKGDTSGKAAQRSEKRQNKCISQLTRTGRERQFPGILASALKLGGQRRRSRITFNEITKNAVRQLP